MSLNTLRHRSALVIASLVMFAPSGRLAERQSPMCAIDMGSNTFRRIVGTFQDGRYVQLRVDQRTLGVGDDVTRNGRISDQKLGEIDEALATFKRACEKDSAARVVAVGTAAFRDAPNGGRAVEIARRLGIAMEIATEQRESELAYLVGSLGREDQAVVDNGSRSIELVAKQGGTLRYTVLPLGYRVAYEAFFATAGDPAAATLAFRERLRKEFSNASFMKGQKRLVGVEFGEMASGLFEPAAVEGRVFTLGQLQRRLQQITTLGPAAFTALKKTKDIDRALPRLVAAVAVAEEFGYAELILTERELGAGLIIEAVLKPSK